VFAIYSVSNCKMVYFSRDFPGLVKTFSLSC
jgi:hypothetical protein